MHSATLTLKLISERLITLRSHLCSLSYIFTKTDKMWSYCQQVRLFILILIGLCQVSCDLYYTFSPESSWFGLTSHTWSFLTEIGFYLMFFLIHISLYVLSGGDVYNIYATISLNPKTNTLFDLRFESQYYIFCYIVIAS